ncbi:hypothetical protein ACH5RR_020907 [Cinchona calisaya]|uniref:Ankyrin repeat protein n=1 Tax=Cinchona calisaya TaxID=153742 RepID=A0ABD2ZH13_9GENT
MKILPFVANAIKALKELIIPVQNGKLKNQQLEPSREEGVKPLDKRGDTVLHFLAIYGNVAAFTLLLEEGLVINENLKTKNVNGDTALHEAARFGKKRVAEIVLSREKELVFDRNNLGETPLFIANACGKNEVFTFMENFNSDGMMRRNDGCTIFHAAVIGKCYSFEEAEDASELVPISSSVNNFFFAEISKVFA